MKIKRLLKLLGNLMIILYLAIGIMLLFTSLFSENIQPRPRIILGIICILYALFRSYRAYVNYKAFNEYEN